MGRIGSRSGQSSVLAAMLCGMLVVFVAMMTNVGTLVTERMAMQNAVDLAAWSGAATQAKYLNKIRDHNQNIWSKLRWLRETFQTSAEPRRDPGRGLCVAGTHYQPHDRTPGCPEMFHDRSSDSYVGECSAKGQIPGIRFHATGNGYAEAVAHDAQDYIDGEQTLIARDAYEARGQAARNAADTADANYAGLGSARVFHTMQGADPMGIVRLEKTEVDVSYFGYCVEHPLFHPPYVVVAFTPTTIHMTAWEYKVEDGDVLFAAKAENAHSAHPFFDLVGGYFMNANDRCWGGNSQQNGRCGIDVFAAAMPFYGKLGSQPCLDGKYDAYCAPDRGDRDRWNQNSGFLLAQTDHPEALDPEQPFSCKAGSGYCNYRVRMVGVFENDLGWVGGAGQAQNAFVPDWAYGRIVH